ncbi:glycerophosphodiester phosphodiesterase [Haloarchaeobius sp. DT45]|uniref:glycerophosphodiester phosphodiesterase n=1 Tax=Haloarchaeobius sp. DT45 TaxID=3446116 RepID=UPI003F6D7D7C
MRLIAHRGFASEAPENTVAAVEHAVSAGADVVEVDVRRCASGDVVVHHDETVDRVTDGRGPVSAHSFADLQGLTVLGSGDGVPSLSQVLDVLPADVGINVELKETGLAADVAALLADHEGDAMVSSFQEAALREMREADPSVPTAYLTDRFRDRPVSTARDLGCSFVHPHYRLCLLSRLVERAHDAGLEVNVWTIRHAAIARLLDLRGVDGVTSDRSGILD